MQFSIYFDSVKYNSSITKTLHHIRVKIKLKFCSHLSIIHFLFKLVFISNFKILKQLKYQFKNISDKN